MNIIIYFDFSINNVDVNINFKCLECLGGGYNFNKLESSHNISD